jgi:hypothetical protein
VSLGSAIEAQQWRAGNRPQKEMAPARGGALGQVEGCVSRDGETQAIGTTHRPRFQDTYWSVNVPPVLPSSFSPLVPVGAMFLAGPAFVPRSRIPVCSTTRVKSAIVFPLMVNGSGLSRPPDLRHVAAGEEAGRRRR